MKLNGLKVVSKFPKVNSTYKFNVNPNERFKVDVNKNAFSCIHETKKGDEWVITGATGARGPIAFVEKRFSKVMNVISSVMNKAENIK